jgi:ankyrin repeat protein
MEFGADPKVHAPDGPLLCKAAMRGDAAMAKVLLGGGADIRDGGPGGMTPLHVAASLGRAPMARFLIEHGAPLDLLDEDGLDPMGWAIDERQEEAAIELARMGADLSAVYVLGDLELGPMEWAEKKGLWRLVDVMKVEVERAAIATSASESAKVSSAKPRL